jgi:hypothetical protein
MSHPIRPCFQHVFEEGGTMAGRRSSKRNRWSHAHKARRRAVGVGSSIGAFLAFGLQPLAAAPEAHADPFDVLVDQVVNALSGSWGDAAAAAATVSDVGALSAGAADPMAAWDLGSLFGAGSAADTNPFDTWLQGVEQAWIGLDQQPAWSAGRHRAQRLV